MTGGFMQCHNDVFHFTNYWFPKDFNFIQKVENIEHEIAGGSDLNTKSLNVISHIKT